MVDEIQKNCRRRTEDVCRQVDISKDVTGFTRLPQVSSQAMCAERTCGSGNRVPNRVIAEFIWAFISTGATFGLRNTGFVHCFHGFSGFCGLLVPIEFCGWKGM